MEELERALLGVKWEECWCGVILYADDIALVADSGVELLTVLEVVQAYVMRWRMKFNCRKSKIMVVEKIGEEIIEEVEVFKYNEVE